MYLIRDEYQNTQRTHNLTTKRQPDPKMGKGCFHKDIHIPRFPTIPQYKIKNLIKNKNEKRQDDV